MTSDPDPNPASLPLPAGEDSFPLSAIDQALLDILGWRFYPVGPGEYEWLKPHALLVPDGERLMQRHQQPPTIGQALDQIRAFVAAAPAEIAHARADRDRIARESVDTVMALRAAREEIEVLREWGNNVCTELADAELVRLRAERDDRWREAA